MRVRDGPGRALGWPLGRGPDGPDRGVYSWSPSGRRPLFHSLGPPNAAEVERVVRAVRLRIQRLLARLGLSDGDGSEGDGSGPAATDPGHAHIQEASVLGRVSTGARHGRSVERDRGPLPARSPSGARPLLRGGTISTRASPSPPPTAPHWSACAGTSPVRPCTPALLLRRMQVLGRLPTGCSRKRSAHSRLLQQPVRLHPHRAVIPSTTTACSPRPPTGAPTSSPKGKIWTPPAAPAAREPGPASSPELGSPGSNSSPSTSTSPPPSPHPPHPAPAPTGTETAWPECIGRLRRTAPRDCRGILGRRHFRDVRPLIPLRRGTERGLSRHRSSGSPPPPAPPCSRGASPRCEPPPPRRPDPR